MCVPSSVLGPGDIMMCCSSLLSYAVVSPQWGLTLEEEQFMVDSSWELTCFVPASPTYYGAVALGFKKGQNSSE